MNSSPNNALAAELAGKILNQQMGVASERVPGQMTVLGNIPRPLSRIIKSYEVKPYGRINPWDKNEPVLPRNFSWDLKNHIHATNTFADAAFHLGLNDSEKEFGLNTVVAYEKYLGALQDIRDGNIGEAQKLIIRQSPKILRHYIAEKERSIKNEEEGIAFLKDLVEKETTELDKKRMEERVFITEQDKLNSEIALGTMNDIIVPLHAQLAAALGIELQTDSPSPGQAR